MVKIIPLNGYPSNKIKQRTERVLAQFDELPDSMMVDVRIVSAMRGRSVASTWRDVQNGLLAKPIKLSPGSTRWRVGDLRKSIKAEV